jgi:hypothetical protein
LPDLADVDGVGGDAFFFDELLDLVLVLVTASSTEELCRQLTISSVFAALSLTNGRAITGIRSLAEMWPFWLFLRRSYGTDMILRRCQMKVCTECKVYGGRPGVVQQKGSGDSRLARLCRAMLEAKLPANGTPDRVFAEVRQLSPLNAATGRLACMG